VLIGRHKISLYNRWNVFRTENFNLTVMSRVRTMESLMSSMVSTSVDTTYSFFDAEALIIDTRKERTVAVFCVNKIKNYK
jgi:hypothetical protein